MSRKVLSFLAGMGCCLALAACASKVAELKPKGTATVKLLAETKSTSVNIKLNDLVAITLPVAAEGHQWQITFHDARYVKQMSNVTPGGTADSGATVSFLALNGGRTRLRFALISLTSGRVADPVDLQELILVIQ